MKNGATFGGRHSYWDFNLLAKKRPIVSMPEPKTKLIEVPGSDSVIDLTETMTGKVHYGLRTITCVYVLMGEPETQERVYTDLSNHLHGKHMSIILDNDPEYFYTGRARISKWEPGQFSATITITVEVEPYKTARFVAGKKVL